MVCLLYACMAMYVIICMYVRLLYQSNVCMHVCMYSLFQFGYHQAPKADYLNRK